MPSAPRLPAVAAVAMACCVACGGSGSGRDDSPATLAREALEHLPGVETVQASQEPPSTPGSENKHPTTVDITVVMADAATAAEVASASAKAAVYSANHAGGARWTAHVTQGEVSRGDDTGTMPRVQVEAYPNVKTSASADARAVTTIAALAHVQSAAMAEGRLTVEVDDAHDVGLVATELRASSAWSDGGSIDADLGRVQINDVPDRITSAQLEAISASAVDHPQAVVAVTSSGDSPEVYDDKVSPAEAAQITAAWTAPRLSHRDADGFVLEFDIRAGSGSTNVDSHGTFGEPSS